MRTSTETLIKAMRIVSDGNDGVVSVAIAEAAQRLEEQQDRIKRLEEAGDGLLTAMRDDWSEYVDWIDETTDAIGKWNKAKEAKL